jgi:hypothetical protein
LKIFQSGGNLFAALQKQSAAIDKMEAGLDPRFDQSIAAQY